MKLEEALERVKGKNPNAWAVGGILRELCRMSDRVCELVEQDLDNPEMDLEICFEALKEHARKHQTGGCWACPVFEITPENEAVKVILDFYKVPPEWITTADADRGTARAGGGTEGQDFDLLNLL